MMPLLAEAAFELTTEKAGAGTIVAAAFSFLWIKFQRSEKRDAIEKKEMRDELRVIKEVVNNSAQFTAGVAAASMVGPTVSSALIQDLHEQHKPSDASGIYRPIPRHRPKTQ